MLEDVIDVRCVNVAGSTLETNNSIALLE